MRVLLFWVLFVDASSDHAILVFRRRVSRTVSERILARDPMEEIRRAFQLFDDDSTGKISLRNLRRVAKEIGDRLEDDELCVPCPSAMSRVADVCALLSAFHAAFAKNITAHS